MSKLLERPVLVLNGDYQPLSKYPLSLNSTRRIIKSLLKGSISVLKEYNETISIKNETIKLPKIVVLKRYIPINHAPKFSRKNVYLRDGYTCQYCGKRFSENELTFDHVFPKSYGGKTNWDNIVTACKCCNHHKGGRTPEEAHMKLINKPFVPSSKLLERNSNIYGNRIYSDWMKELETI